MNMAVAFTDDMRAYAWPARFTNSLHVGEGGFRIDFGDILASVSHPEEGARPLVFSVLTETYLPIFDRWLALARTAGFNRFLIGYIGASSIGEHLRGSGVPCFGIGLPNSFLADISFRNKGGFSATGAAVIYSRILVAERLVSAGFDVLCCDVDAWILRPPRHLETATADISFQRVAYFPAQAVEQWGFALCGGFIFYRASARSATWLKVICGLMGEVSSDQLASNVAMLRQGVMWDTDVPRGTLGRKDLEEAFRRTAMQPIEGEIPTMKLSLLALPATLYWRHTFVEPDRQQCILMHPNSSKVAGEKLQTLQRWCENLT